MGELITLAEIDERLRRLPPLDTTSNTRTELSPGVKYILTSGLLAHLLMPILEITRANGPGKSHIEREHTPLIKGAVVTAGYSIENGWRVMLTSLPIVAPEESTFDAKIGRMYLIPNGLLGLLTQIEE